MRSAGFGPAYKSLTVQPAPPELKNPPWLSQVRMEYLINNFKEMKLFFTKERLYLNNKYFQQKSSPTFTGKRSKNNKHTKINNV